MSEQDEMTPEEKARAEAIAKHPERRGTKTEVFDGDGTLLIDSFGYYTPEGARRSHELAVLRREHQPLLDAVYEAGRPPRPAEWKIV